MVAEARAWVDVESAVREWVRDSIPDVSRRAFFGPAKDAPLPQIVVYRVAGADANCAIQFDVWGQSKAQAATIAAVLCSAIDALSRYVYATAGVLLHGAAVDSERWQPDDESDAPRYIVDATFTASKSS